MAKVEWVESKINELRKELTASIKARQAQELEHEVERAIEKARKKLEGMMDLDVTSLLKEASPKGKKGASAGGRSCGACGLPGTRLTPEAKKALGAEHTRAEHEAFKAKAAS